MKMSFDLLDYFKNNKSFDVFEVQKGHYNFEYSIEKFNEGDVYGVIELENEIISELGNNTIGYFGINLEHKIVAYYLMR